MEKTKETRSGVSVHFLAMIAWLSAIGAEWISFLVAGAILFLEKDSWLKKQMIKVLTLTAVVRVFNTILFSHMLEVIFPSGAFLPMVIIKICIYLAEDALWIVLALRAYKKTPSHTSLDHFAGMCLEGEMTSPDVSSGSVYTGNQEPLKTAATGGVCPNCGRPISEDMDFCVNCGTKVR